jgi:alanyl-tRNA synthetase
MTTRLYYADSMLQSFTATVTSCEAASDRIEVVLDQTAFYPTSGGQPFDVGTLGTARVIEVVDRDNGSIGHVVSEPIAAGQRVTGSIDWARRFDHMQQHTGQHILSAAFDRLHGVRTESFHMGGRSSTIDLAREATPAEIDAAEAAACRVVWEDRPITVRVVSEDEAARLPLRKEPVRQGELRVVEVEDFDLSACGGTHVPRAGMVGIIAVTGWERFKGGSRIAFACGGRALKSHAELRDRAHSASRLLSVGADDVPAAIEKLQADARQLGKTVDRLREENARLRAAELRLQAETVGGLRVVLRAEGGADMFALKTMAAAIVSEPGMVAVLVGEGRPAEVVVARSADVAFDAGGWMRRATAALGGRGGGRPELAQGGIPTGAGDVLAFARQALEERRW